MTSVNLSPPVLWAQRSPPTDESDIVDEDIDSIDVIDMDIDSSSAESESGSDLTLVFHLQIGFEV